MLLILPGGNYNHFLKLAPSYHKAHNNPDPPHPPGITLSTVEAGQGDASPVGGGGGGNPLLLVVPVVVICQNYGGPETAWTVYCQFNIICL